MVLAVAVCVLPFGALEALAALGYAEPWQLGMQDSGSPIRDRLDGFHTLLLVIIFAISIFVSILLFYVCWRYRRSANPVPSKTSHNTMLEVIWTIIPVLILLVVVVPSVRGIYFFDKVENADMTIKVVGYQWYWHYKYPDHEDIEFDSYMLKDEELGPNDLRLLSVDNVLVLPVDTTIRVQITAADVMHNWAIPSLGMKIDAIPGRLNETWVKITKPGRYFGQCSELCGVGHGFMPIEILAVSKEEFEAWVAKAKVEFSDVRNFDGVKLSYSLNK